MGNQALAKRFIDEYSTKQISYRYHGSVFTFNVSRELFSSHGIDTGTALLLDSLSSRPQSPVHSILDSGSGSGVLGACLGYKHKGACVLLQDRDALAVLFSKHNCMQNGMPEAATDCNLAFSGIKEKKFDLIVSNIPAKAGSPVHRYMLMRMADCLSASGTAAVVVVRTLESFFRKTLAELGANIHYFDATTGHAVFHFSPGMTSFSAQWNSLDPYWRAHPNFSVDGLSYALSTVYDLPNFSQISTAHKVLFSLMRDRDLSGTVLFWNPGQGHLPVFFCKRFRAVIPVIAGRDMLELKVTRHNMQQNGIIMQNEGISAADIRTLAADNKIRRFSHIVFQVPHAQMLFDFQDVVRTISELLDAEGCLYLSGKSTAVGRVSNPAKDHFRKIRDKKMKGFRSLILQKK